MHGEAPAFDLRPLDNIRIPILATRYAFPGPVLNP